MSTVDATITITSIESHGGTFTAHVVIRAAEFDEIILQVGVEAGTYGEVPRAVYRKISDLGNAIAKAALTS